MKLKQYRKENWPIVDSFVLGIFKDEGGAWNFNFYSNEELKELQISTPYGGYYIWYRPW